MTTKFTNTFLFLCLFFIASCGGLSVSGTDAGAGGGGGNNNGGSENDGDSQNGGDDSEVEVGEQLEFDISDGNPYNRNSAIGTNLFMMDSYLTEWVFIDQFAKSRRWFPARCNGNATMDGSINTNGTAQDNVAAVEDSNGWPIGISYNDTTYWQSNFNGQRACLTTILMDGVDDWLNGSSWIFTGGNYPTGTYVLFWEGSVAPIMRGNASTLTVDNSYTGPNGEHRGTFTVSNFTSQGVQILLNHFNYPNQSQPGGQALTRNIRVIMPGGVCGRSAEDLDYYESCATARGGSGTCGAGETCYDFEEVGYNRFHDPIEEMNNPKVVFHPTTLDRLKYFRTLRFMDWQRINNAPPGNPVVSPSDLRPLTYQTMTDYNRGVALDFIPALSNVLDADAWVNIPHRANDTYVTYLATLLRNRLKPNLKVYVEYTNEAWNSSLAYPQTDYVRFMGNSACVDTVCDAQPATQLCINCVGWGQDYFADRTAQIGTIFKNVFAGRNPERVIRVLGAHGENQTVDTNNPNIFYGSVARSVARRGASAFDAVAIAPYFGAEMGRDSGGIPLVSSVGWGRSAPNGSISIPNALNTAFDQMFNGGHIYFQYENDDHYKSSLDLVQAQIIRNKRITDQYGLKLITYEGGQHVLGIGTGENDLTANQIYLALNRDARMGTATTQNLNDWRQYGGELFVHFTHTRAPGKFGYFGTLEYQNQPVNQAPKYQALINFVQNNDCWWDGCERVDE